VVSFLGLGLVLFGPPRAGWAAPKADAWTPERVRAFVLNVEREMEKLQKQQYEADSPSLAGSCRGYAIGAAIKKSVAMSRIQALMTGKAAACYVGSYLGCEAGEWIGASQGESLGPEEKPFTLSKVTIIEQSPERVVADVNEAAFELVENGVLMDEDPWRPAKDVSWATDKSRYTITRGKDGRWRIADRKPSFAWTCSTALDDDGAGK